MCAAENQNSVVHSTFSIERTYPSRPARVFAAFSNQATKRRWFVEGEGWEIDEFTLDFRVGGHEISRFRFKGGPPMGNDMIYLDIVPDRRIVFAYTMTAGGPVHIKLPDGSTLDSNGMSYDHTTGIYSFKDVTVNLTMTPGEQK